MCLKKVDKKIYDYGDFTIPSSIFIDICFTNNSLDAVRSCKYIDNDSKIMSASDDKTIKIWDVETGQVLHDYTECHDGIISGYQKKMLKCNKNNYKSTKRL
jgi:WD40 repeat protein